MTAFASNILAGLPALGAKSGAEGVLTADGQGAGGVFEALMATLTDGAPAVPTDARGLAAIAPSLPPAAGLGADTGAMMSGAPGAIMVDPLSGKTAEPLATEAEGDTLEDSDAAEALTAAGAVLIAPTPADSQAVARPEADLAATPAAAPVSGAPAAIAAPTDPVVPIETKALAAIDAAASGAGTPALAEPPSAPSGPSATADGPGAGEPAPEAVAEAPVAPPPAAATPRAATEAVTSLIGRVLDGARKTETEVAVRQAAADATPPVEVPAEAVIDTPVELALDTALSPETPVPVEADVAETPVAPTAVSSRRAARPDVARVEVSAEAPAPAAPDVKPAAQTEVRQAPVAAPATLARPELAPLPLADTAAEPEQATLETAPAAPTMQAAAETPAEVVPTRGSPETVARLAADIARKLEGRTTRFDVQLDPLGLGKVDVSIEINADGRLSASLSFDSAQTAADLRGRAGELRQALETAGFDLADGGLSFDMNNPGGSSGREARETLAAWSSRAFQTARSGLEQADALAVRSNSSRTPSGGVDIRI